MPLNRLPGDPLGRDGDDGKRGECDAVGDCGADGALRSTSGGCWL